MSSDSNNNGWGHLLGLALVVAFFLWVTKSPKRIFIFFLVIAAIAIPTMIQEKEEKAKRSELRKAKVAQQAHVEANEHHVWIREALVITLWESYLGSLPAVAETETWQQATLGIDRGDGRRLEKYIRHTEIQKFVEGILSQWLLKEAFTNSSLELPTFSMSQAMHLLRIRQDSDGLYSWRGDVYGGYAYRYVSPTLAIGETDLENLSIISGEHLDALAREVYHKYQSLKRSIAVEDYEINDMPKTIRNAEKRILRTAPNLPVKEAKAIVLRAVEESYKYREFKKEFPDYEAMEADYFQELL